MRFTRSALTRAPGHRSALLTCGLATLALFVITTPALAQFDTGQISGFVPDTSGGIVLQFGMGYTLSRNYDNGSGEIELLPNACDDCGYWAAQISIARTSWS